MTKKMFSKIVTVKNGHDIKIAKMETIRKKDLKTLYYKVMINGDSKGVFTSLHNGIFATRKDMANFMVNKFYCWEN